MVDAVKKVMAMDCMPIMVSLDMEDIESGDAVELGIDMSDMVIVGDMDMDIGIGIDIDRASVELDIDISSAAGGLFVWNGGWC